VASVAAGALLDPAADLIDHLRAQLHDVEGVQHRDGVVEFVADGVGVAAERVESGMLDAVDESGRAAASQAA
jgi:hypothetical protein